MLPKIKETNKNRNRAEEGARWHLVKWQENDRRRTIREDVEWIDDGKKGMRRAPRSFIYRGLPDLELSTWEASALQKLLVAGGNQ
jgi:hypothetical protein